MTNAPVALKTESVPAAPESAPANRKRGKPASPTRVICDLAEASAFVEFQGKPHVPVMSAFGAERMHVCRLPGSWDLERAVGKHPEALFRSVRNLPAQNSVAQWDDLTFQLGPRTFLYIDANRIVGFASTAMEAERLVTQFSRICSKPAAPCGGDFHLIQQNQHGITSHTVTLPPATVLPPEALALHYGNGSAEWHQAFLEKLHARVYGLSIFEGRPGTGKTFYLRHLIGVLKDSHRFYFIPTSSMGILTKPDFISFWADQRRLYAERRFVVILEDADAALMTRGLDNREQVSALLNLSDRMLADFLRLQIICTINCSAADIDPALLRPGRLLCHRVFNRLAYAEAVRLAERLGRKLPVAPDYSLAEVFARQDTEEVPRPRIGFAA